MDNKKRIKYERIAKITGILIGLVLILGTSYAVFKTVTRSEETNTISAGKLDVQIENEQDEILLQKAYPIRDEEGLKQSPYTFEIVNKGSINAEYDLYIEIEENTTLPLNVVRYYLTVEEEEQEKIVTEKARLISQEETTEREGKSLYKIDTKYLDTTKTNKYKLYLWIDYEATKEEASNKYFEAKVVVDAVQIYDKNRLVKQIDVSESGDNSVIAYMYADGTVYIKGQGTIASNLSDTLVYEKEGVLENYKQLLLQAGCNEEEVNAITSIEEFEEYTNNLDDTMVEKAEINIYKIIFGEMGYDTSSIIDFESLDLWLIEQGIVDEEGNTTEEGEEFFNRFYSIYNEKYSTDPIPATKIVLEDGIENIPNGLYTGNESITEVRIPASVVSIDAYAFQGCTGLKEIVIPDSVTSIGNYTFANCTSLTNIILSDSIESIGGWVFYNCNNLTSITIPTSVTSIGNQAFYNCTSLTSIKIPDSVTSIGNWAFSSCTSLTSVTLPNNVTSIGGYTFSNCTSLTKIEIPNSVINIGESAFYNCSSLTTVDIPDSVTSIGSSAFAGCTSLTSTTISNSVTSIGNSAFAGCTSLTSITISNGVTSIGNNSFSNCTSLTSIEIPTSVISIGSSTFSGCTGIKKLIIDGTKNYGNLGISTIEELVIVGSESMYNYSVSNSPWYASKKSIKKVTISNTFTSIGDYAFNNCTELEEIVIPNSVTSIGNYSFYNCSSLTSIKMPTLLINIGNNAFSFCTGLTSIEIPNSVTSIGKYAFYGWTSSQTINIDNTEAYVNANWDSNWKSSCSAQINYLRS